MPLNIFSASLSLPVFLSLSLERGELIPEITLEVYISRNEAGARYVITLRLNESSERNCKIRDAITARVRSD